MNVSVIMPVYNEEKNISESIESILSQDCKVLELIIINDGSEDSTEDIIYNEYGRDKRVRLFNQDNKGFSYSLNKALRASSHDFVARMDADDRCLSGRIEKQSSFLEDNKEVGVVGSDYVRIDNIRNEKYVRRYPKEDEEIRKDMAKYIPISHSSVMFRKEAVTEVGGYNESLTDHEDLDLWIRVAQNWKLANIPEPLVVRHIRNDSYWHRNYDAHARNMHLARLNAKAVRDLSLPFYHYAYPLARLMYPWLPDSVKRIVRRLGSGIEEQDLADAPSIPSY
jgi:glycosyltransferase involved in cell wall biosynthesis